MSFEIWYDAQPRKFLASLDKHIAQRILDKIDVVLTETPVPHNAKAIVGRHGVFRLRVGDYRVLYRIDYHDQKITIIEIDKRSRIY